VTRPGTTPRGTPNGGERLEQRRPQASGSCKRQGELSARHFHFDLLLSATTLTAPTGQLPEAAETAVVASQPARPSFEIGRCNRADRELSSELYLTTQRNSHSGMAVRESYVSATKLTQARSVPVLCAVAGSSRERLGKEVEITRYEPRFTESTGRVFLYVLITRRLSVSFGRLRAGDP